MMYHLKRIFEINFKNTSKPDIDSFISHCINYIKRRNKHLNKKDMVVPESTIPLTRVNTVSNYEIDNCKAEFYDAISAILTLLEFSEIVDQINICFRILAHCDIFISDELILKHLKKSLSGCFSDGNESIMGKVIGQNIFIGDKTELLDVEFEDRSSNFESILYYLNEKEINKNEKKIVKSNFIDFDIIIYNQFILRKGIFNKEVLRFFKLKNQYANNFLNLTEEKYIFIQLELIETIKELEFNKEYFLNQLNSENKFLAFRINEAFHINSEENDENPEDNCEENLEENKTVEDEFYFLYNHENNLNNEFVDCPEF